jgi:hypothetical protein
VKVRVFILILLFGITAQAADLKDFCTNPYQAICSDSADSRKKGRETEIALELRSSALAIAEVRARALGITVGISALSPAARTRHFMLPAMRETEHRLYLTVVEEMAQRRAGISAEDLRTLFAELRSFYLTLVGTRPLFRERLERMDLVSSADYVHVHGRKLQYLDVCGDSGLLFNARNDEPWIVICPGLYTSLEARGATREQTLDYLALALGHELAHAVDVESFPRAYPFLRGRGESRNELSADGWAITAGVQRFGGRSSAEVAAAWKLYYSGFCGPIANEHATDRARIEHLLKREDVRTQLGCALK